MSPSLLLPRLCAPREIQASGWGIRASAGETRRCISVHTSSQVCPLLFVKYFQQGLRLAPLSDNGPAISFLHALSGHAYPE